MPGQMSSHTNAKSDDDGLWRLFARAFDHGAFMDSTTRPDHLAASLREFVAAAVKFTESGDNSDLLAALSHEDAVEEMLTIPARKPMRPFPADVAGTLARHGHLLVARLSRATNNSSSEKATLVPACETIQAADDDTTSATQEHPSRRRTLSFEQFATIQIPAAEDRFLIDHIWASGGNGIIAGEAKVGKTWLVSEFAVAVASGTPFLGAFTVQRSGPVLVCAMEGPSWLASERLAGICRHRGVSPADLPLHVLRDPSLRLDTAADQEALRGAIQQFRPVAVMLDPLVRMHSQDENAAGGMNRVLEPLRVLGREFNTAIVLVHHNNKGSSLNARPGLALRGSSDLHAWGDSNLYLRETQSVVTIHVEHRAAEAPDPIRVRLVGGTGMSHFEVVAPEDEPAGAEQDETVDAELDERILGALVRADGPMTIAALRTTLGVRNDRISRAVPRLIDAGQIDRCPGGVRLCRTIHE